MNAMTISKETSSSHELLNPQMLTLAREYAGFTQTELAEELSVSQGIVSKLEEGMNTGDQALIDKLSSIFNRPEAFFTQRPSVSMTLEGHFRKKSSLTKKLLRATDARMRWMVLRFYPKPMCPSSSSIKLSPQIAAASLWLMSSVM